MARYDTIGHGYSRARREDARLRVLIRAAPADARTVVNVGSGDATVSGAMWLMAGCLSESARPTC